MRPRGRSWGDKPGGSRGRGAKTRGGGSRGRSHFASKRLEEQDDVSKEGPSVEKPLPADEIEDVSEQDSSEDEEAAHSSRPYVALLQSFATSEGSRSKRRKLSHPTPERSGDASRQPKPERATEDVVDQADLAETPRSEDDFVDAAENLEDEVDDESDGAEELQDDDSSDDEAATSDPFDSHFGLGDDRSWTAKVKAIQENQLATEKRLLQRWRAVVTYPKVNKGQEVPSLTPISGFEELNLKQKLREPAMRKIGALSEVQQMLAPLLFNHHDLLFNGRNLGNADHLRQLVCLHALNHVFKTRDRVLKNQRKLADNPDAELRFQGFTRPRVLFLLPTKNACLKMINTMRDLYQPEQQENRKRFDEGYGDHGEPIGANKPADFRDLFEGDEDDMFRIGIKFAGKTMKFFAPFYSSDVLLASPLGLRTAIGSDDEKKKKMDYDFLSSIEVCVVDHADALLMQNWEHVEYAFEHMNRQPREPHGCDYNHVRMWYLDDLAKHFRQTIVLSSFNTPELSELMRAHCRNWAGQVRLTPEYPGAIQSLGASRCRQTFSRFDSKSLGADPDSRFNYFVSAIVPSLTKRARDATGTLIFVPSYLDFVRLRNYFAGGAAVSSLSFGAVSEYASVPDASRARAHFLSGRHRVLLYTERAHHFRRFAVKGVRRVVFYSLPDNPIFYREIAGEFLAASERHGTLEPGQGSVRVVFSRYDVMKLERIVGSQRVGRMISDKGDTFEFV